MPFLPLSQCQLHSRLFSFLLSRLHYFTPSTSPFILLMPQITLSPSSGATSGPGGPYQCAVISLQGSTSFNMASLWAAAPSEIRCTSWSCALLFPHSLCQSLCSLLRSRCLFLNTIFGGATSITDGLSCVLWVRSRAGWNQLCLAWGSPSPLPTKVTLAAFPLPKPWQVHSIDFPCEKLLQNFISLVLPRLMCLWGSGPISDLILYLLLATYWSSYFLKPMSRKKIMWWVINWWKVMDINDCLLVCFTGSISNKVLVPEILYFEGYWISVVP